MKDSLFSIYIKSDLASQSLTSSALSQVILNLLLKQERSVSISEISSLIETAIRATISKEQIQTALDDLISNRLTFETSSLYQLTSPCKKQLLSRLRERSQRYNGIASKYFGKTDCPIEVLHEWFNEVNVRYFCEYSLEWINEITGIKQEQKGHSDYIRIINDPGIYTKFGISKQDRQWLAAQYIKFLRSYDPIDNALMWDYANSMFMARLLSSNIYIDRSIHDLFEGSKIVLDTNILMYLDLEKDFYSDSYRTLEDVFLKMNIQPIYFHISEQEYKQAVTYKINEIEKIIDRYEYEVYSKIDDPFIKTAIHRSCSTPEHFHIFFQELCDFPSVLSSALRIEKYDYSELNIEIEKGGNNQKLKSKMNKIFLRTHKKDKKEGSLEHDAGLIKGAEFLRNDHKCWILTRDGTVHSYSIENVKRDDFPITINLDTVINLLAMNEPYIAEESGNFASLFANLVRSDIFPEREIFQAEDLMRMYEIEAQITQLPNDMILEIAKEVNHERLKGTNDSRIALSMHRKIQSHRMEIKDKLLETNAKLQQSIEDKDRHAEAYSKIEKAFIEERRDALESGYRRKRRRDIAISSFLTAIVIAGITILVFLLRNIVSTRPFWTWAVAFLINFVSNVVTIKYLYLPLFRRKYKDKLAGIDDEIREEINKIRSQQ